MDKDGILRVPESGTPGTPTTGSVKRWIKRACSPADLAHSRDIIGLWISITKQTDLILDSDSQSFFFSLAKFGLCFGHFGILSILRIICWLQAISKICVNEDDHPSYA